MQGVLLQLGVLRNIDQINVLLTQTKCKKFDRSTWIQLSNATKLTIIGSDIFNTASMALGKKFPIGVVFELAVRVCRVFVLISSQIERKLESHIVTYECMKELANIARLTLELGLIVASPYSIVATAAFDVGLRVAAWALASGLPQRTT